MRKIHKKRYNIIDINPDIYDKTVQLICGVSGYGLSLICNFIFIKFGIDINFPVEIHLLKGFSKNLFYKSKKLKNGHKLEIQCYFKDILNTGISICHNVPDNDLDRRSYISISFLGLSLYIADCYCLSVPC